jgi:hypothetical protein
MRSGPRTTGSGAIAFQVMTISPSTYPELLSEIAEMALVVSISSA